MATLKDIAEAAEVSVFTVSTVLNGKAKKARISEKRAEEILRIADRLNYRPHAAARAMRSQTTRQVGILVPNNPGNRYTHPMAYETVLGINEGLQAAGYVATLARIDDVKADLSHASRVFKEHVLDGMIVLDSMPKDVEQQLEELIPLCIWCDSNVWRDERCIRRDERAVGRRIGEAAVDLGYRRVVWVGYPENLATHFSSIERLGGLREALAPAGIDPIIQTEPRLAQTEHLDQTIAQLRGDTCIVTNSLYQARKLRTIAEGLGKCAGHDFGLICCDDAKQLDRMWPGLTRVTFDRYAMGMTAAKMMLNLIEKPDGAVPSVLLEDRWQPGNTAWGPRPNRSCLEEEPL